MRIKVYLTLMLPYVQNASLAWDLCWQGVCSGAFWHGVSLLLVLLVSAICIAVLLLHVLVACNALEHFLGKPAIQGQVSSI